MCVTILIKEKEVMHLRGRRRNGRAGINTVYVFIKLIKYVTSMNKSTTLKIIRKNKISCIWKTESPNHMNSVLTVK